MGHRHKTPSLISCTIRIFISGLTILAAVYAQNQLNSQETEIQSGSGTVDITEITNVMLDGAPGGQDEATEKPKKPFPSNFANKPNKGIRRRQYVFRL